MGNEHTIGNSIHPSLEIKEGDCVEDWPSQDYVKVYTVSVFLVLYLIPLTLITICYTKICIYLYQEARRWKTMTKYYGTSVRQVRRISKARHMQNIKIIKAFVAAVMAFAICQLPTHVIWLWNDLGSGGQWKYLYDVLPFCHILTYLNSAIDPFIFGSLDAKLLEEKMRTMLKCSNENKDKENKSMNRTFKRQTNVRLSKNLMVKRRSSTMESTV